MSIPEGATHVVADIYSLRDAQKAMNNKYPYRRKDGDSWLAFVDDEWVNVWLPEPYRYQKIEKQWSGPQDGLPPVNSVCEFVSSDTSWGKVKIIAHDDGKVVFKPSGDSYYGVTPDHKAVFLPFIDPEQQRETAIREFMDIVGIDCRVTAGKAVDAGFKRDACKSDCSTNNRGVPELLGPCDCR
jgi:hypothetical protein